jgi:hypothetical protein
MLQTIRNGTFIMGITIFSFVFPSVRKNTQKYVASARLAYQMARSLHDLQLQAALHPQHIQSGAEQCVN